ncbi:MAG: glycosyltransferase family 4 protein [Chloroflexi bacterium]|nr:glycosyltransferase family 4 protein [Chloroflexota bacterium]
MRIGLIIYGSIDTLSGGFLYDRQLVRALQRRGHTVQVISFPWRGYAQHLAHNIRPDIWHRLRQANVDLWLQDELNHPSLVLLNRGLRRDHPAPIISIVHHLRQDEVHPPAVRRIYRWVENAYLRGVHGFIFNSRTTRERVHTVLGRAAEGIVAYPAADHLTGSRAVPFLTPDEVRARALEDGPLRAVFLGNLIPRKGLHTLIRALAHLPRGSVTLDIVGREDVDRAYSTRVRRLVQQHGLTTAVRFWGYLDQGDLHRLIRRMHLLAVPSQYEGFGIVYLEGMAFGLPAIAGNRGAAHEIVTPGENGELVPPEEPEVLGRHLIALHRDRERLSRMGIAALERFRRHPTWEESMGRAVQWLETWAPRPS